MQCVKCRGCGQLKLRYCFLNPHSSCTHDEAYSQSPSPMQSAGGAAIFRNLSFSESSLACATLPQMCWSTRRWPNDGLERLPDLHERST